MSLNANDFILFIRQKKIYNFFQLFTQLLGCNVLLFRTVMLTNRLERVNAFF